MTLEERVKSAAENAIVKAIQDGGWTTIPWDQRLKIPPDMLADVWGLIDRKALTKKLAVRIEAELADRIVNHIAAELATDIKQILSVPERREAVRALAREHMDSIMKKGVPSV
jgi:hypothetical protein